MKRRLVLIVISIAIVAIGAGVYLWIGLNSIPNHVDPPVGLRSPYQGR